MINLILATDVNWCIGKNNWLCWDLKEDLKYFSEKTKWNIVIMWKNTYLSLPQQFRPLPWRINFVVSRSLKDDNVKVFKDLNTAIQEAKKLWKEIFLIGWKSIYDEWIKLADRIYLTQVKQAFDCDVCLWEEFFEELFNNFKRTYESLPIKENWITYQFITLDRINKKNW